MRTAPIVTKLEAALAGHVASIWEYVRENRDSLDSERGRKMIGAALDEAVAESMKMLIESEKKLAVKRGECRELKKTVRELEAEDDQNILNVSLLEKRCKAYLDTLDRINEAYSAIRDERGLGCDCDDKGPGAACDVCEISHLLNELFPNEDGDDN